MADVDYDFDAYDPRAAEDGVLPGDAAPAGALRRWVNLAGALCSVGLVIGAGIWGYNLAIRDVEGVPVIMALEGPMRVAPEDPGGEVIEYQGLSVNGVAAVGAAAPMPERLVLAPPPLELDAEDRPGLAGLKPDTALVAAPAVAASGEGPTLAADPLSESESPTEVAVDAALAEALGESGDGAPDPVIADPTAPPDVELAMESLPEGAIVLSPRPKPRPEVAAAATPATEADPVPKTLAAEIDPATIPLGTRLVQFGAFDTEDEARAEWARLEAGFGELMAGKSMVLQPAERSGQVFYRLRAHGFADEDDARRFCVAIAAKGSICIPVAQK